MNGVNERTPQRKPLVSKKGGKVQQLSILQKTTWKFNYTSEVMFCKYKPSTTQKYQRTKTSWWEVETVKGSLAPQKLRNLFVLTMAFCTVYVGL